MKRVNPDDVERVRSALQTAFDRIEAKRSTTEFRLRRGDGNVRWVETLGLAHFQGERGAAGVVGTVADIAGRKQHEEREHLLTCEVSHRAKDMLSVADVIAHATTRNPEDFIKRFSERIPRSTRALRRPHRFRYRRAWSQAVAGGWCVAIGLALHDSPTMLRCTGRSAWRQHRQSGARRIAMCQKAGIEARHRLFDRRKVSCACLARRYAGSAPSGCQDTMADSRRRARSRIVAEAACERSVSFATVSDVPMSCNAVGPKSPSKPQAK
jgi:hypothetical protein